MYNNSSKQQANPIASPPIFIRDIHLFLTKERNAILKFKENILSDLGNTLEKLCQL